MKLKVIFALTGFILILISISIYLIINTTNNSPTVDNVIYKVNVNETTKTNRKKSNQFSEDKSTVDDIIHKQVNNENELDKVKLTESSKFSEDTILNVDLDNLRKKMIDLDEQLLSEDMAKHKNRIKQHEKDYKSWLEKVEETHNEWMRLTNIDIKTPEEYQSEVNHINSLTDMERKAVMDKHKQDIAHYQSVYKQLSDLLKNEPVLVFDNQSK